MLLVNELLFAYFSIGPSSKFNLWDYCYDEFSSAFLILTTARLGILPLNSISLKSIRPTRAGDRKPHVASLK